MKMRQLLVFKAEDTGIITNLEWIDIETKSPIVSRYERDNRITFLDNLNVNKLSDIEGKIFWCQTYLGSRGGIVVNPGTIIPINAIEERLKQLKIEHTENHTTNSQSYYGKMAAETKQKYRVLRSFIVSLDYAEQNKHIVDKYLPHLSKLIAEMRSVIKEENIPQGKIPASVQKAMTS